MNIVFFGSSEFSIAPLKKILEKGPPISLVVTKKSKSKGRGKKPRPTIVKEFCDKKGIDVLEIDKPSASLASTIKKRKIDVLVLASYGAIISQNILNIVKYPINIHPSLLPKYRGAAPVQRALMNGEKETGISLFFMNEKMDAGNIILQKRVKILPFEVATELSIRLSELGGDMLIDILNNIKKRKNLESVPQNESDASYAPRIQKEELIINWGKNPDEIVNKIRGLSYKPGAYTLWREKRLKILRAVPLKGSSRRPGSIVSLRGYIIVSVKEGLVGIKEVQLEGKKVMDSELFINGYRPQIGEILGRGR